MGNATPAVAIVIENVAGWVPVMGGIREFIIGPGNPHVGGFTAPLGSPEMTQERSSTLPVKPLSGVTVILT